MKRKLSCLLFVIVFFYGNYIYSTSNSFPRVELVGARFEPVCMNLTSNANELVYYYNMYGLVKPPEGELISPDIARMLRSRGGWRPRELTQNHSTEEYREAWEELLPYWIDNSIRNVGVMHERIKEYFTQLKSKESTDVFFCCMKQTIKLNYKHFSAHETKNKQTFLLGMFLKIRTDESFDALVKSLNLLEQEYINIPAPEDSIYNEHPWVYYKKCMLQQDRKPVTKHDVTWLGYTEEWQEMATNYDTSNLHPKTKKFVEDIAVYRHPYIDYSDDPILGTNVIEVLAETNTAEQIIEETVITNLVVETVEPIPDIEISTNDVEEIVIVDEETPSKNRMLIILIIAIAVIIIGVIVSRRKSH